MSSRACASACAVASSALRAPACAARAERSARSRDASPARIRRISTPSFSARSAALAWSARAAKPLLDLTLEVAGALHLLRDARELQLGAVTATLETSQARSLLDERPPLAGRRREDGFHLALADNGTCPWPKPDVGEQLDHVRPAHGRSVDEVLPLAATVEAPCDRHLLEVEPRQRAADVIEAQLDLAVGRRRGARRSRRRARRQASRRAARSARGCPKPRASASAMFDLPDPLGPTTTATPGSRRTSTGSGNDLKPRMVIARRCTAAQR